MTARVVEPSLALASLIALLVAGVVSLLVLHRLDSGEWTGTLRRRFVLGVPWGTGVVVALLLGAYLFVQGAWTSPSDPVVVPFRSWSFYYPLGMVTSSFTHANPGHLTGNVLWTVVFGTVAEYAWGHFPRERGSQTFSSLRTNPFGRIAIFVGAVLLVGLAGNLFVPGPVIGFSGVVFALAGFALVTVPIHAIVAIVAVRIVRVLYFAIVEPVVVAQARQEYVQPWFAEVAVQGHAFGLLVGILLGAAVVVRSDRAPTARHVWFATLAFASVETLYAIYWYLGTDTYQLFRAAGVAGVLVLVALVAGVVTAGDGRPIPRSELTWRHLAAGLLLAAVFGIGLAAVPYNLADVDDVDREGAVEVRDYTIFYVEDVEHGYVSAIDLPPILSSVSESARASGVIVASERRNAWEVVVATGELSLRDRASVSVGGLGWRERVAVTRTAWDAVDAGDTYKVFLQRPGQSPTLAYADNAVMLSPQVAGHNLTIEPTESDYRLNVTQNGSRVDRAPVPTENETVEIAEITFERDRDSLFASHEGTRVRLARYEEPGS